MIFRHDTTNSSASPSERGETLLELMATVVLMGVAIVALVGSVIGVMAATTHHRRTTRAANETVTVAEALRRAPYKPCATVASTDTSVAAGNSYRPNLPVAPANVTYEIVAIRRLTSTSSPAVFTDGAPCSPDLGVQEIRVKVRVTGGQAAARHLTFVKRNKACPVGATTTTAVGATTTLPTAGAC